MLSMFILGVGLLLAVLLLSRWYVSADPKTLLKALKWVALSLAMCAIVWLALTGKLWAAIAALPAVMIWFMRLFTGLRYMQMLRRMLGLGGAGAGWSSPGTGAHPKGGQTSDVRTRFVVMRLDHATGQVSGEVLEGRFAGRRLNDLNLDELLELLLESQADADSARLVESYLERRAPGWRTRQKSSSNPSGGPPGGPPGGMTRAEALRVLGLSDGASLDAIKAAHRRLMAQVHPDHGGTDYLAQQINQAKDVLMAKTDQ